MSTQEHGTIRKAARKSAQEAFSQLPDTEPERSRMADPTLPVGFWQHEMRWLEENLERTATEQEENIYEATWEERYEELMVEADLARNIKEARA